jgi:hypothetical protein
MDVCFTPVLLFGQILESVSDRTRSSLYGFCETLTVEHFSGIEAVALDMWDPYIASVRGRARENPMARSSSISFMWSDILRDPGKSAAAGEQNSEGCWGPLPGKETLRLAAEPHLDWSRKTVRNSPNRERVN